MLKTNAPPQVAAPPAIVSRASTLSDRLVFHIAAAVTIAVFICGIYAPYFIVDSWSYLELSNTVFKDFYRFNTLRQFESGSPYSNSFPPLWPILLALVRIPAQRLLSWDPGIYGGYVLNCAICIGLLAALIRLFRTMDLPGWAGAACYFCIFGFPPFLGDALGAKTIALSMALLICSLQIFVRERLTTLRIAAAGGLMALACLNRFDALLAACVIGLAFALRAYRFERRLRHAIVAAVVFGATLGVVLLPWAVYGMKHFGRLFPSDNVRTLARAWDGNVLDYYETPPTPDLTQNPGKWISGFVLQKAPAVVGSGFYEAAAESKLLVPLLAAILVLWGATCVPRLSAEAVRFTVLGLGLIPVILFPAALVGYWDTRYYAPPMMLIFIALLVVLVRFNPGAWNARRAAILLLLTALPLSRAIVHPLNYNHHRLVPNEARTLLSPNEEMRRVTDSVRRDAAGKPHRLVLTTGSIESAKYGALTGEPTSVMPRLVNGTFAAFARDWHITHVYDPPGKMPVTSIPRPTDPAIVLSRINTPGVELVPLDLPGLYRIRLTADRQIP